MITEEDSVPYPRLPLRLKWGFDADDAQAVKSNCVDNSNANDAVQPPWFRVRAVNRLDESTLPSKIQHKIQALKMSIVAKRPPAPQAACRGASRRKSERWSVEEDQFLLLMRDNGFGYRQIEEFFTWRHRNSLEQRVSKLRSDKTRGKSAVGRKLQNPWTDVTPPPDAGLGTP